MRHQVPKDICVLLEQFVKYYDHMSNSGAVFKKDTPKEVLDNYVDFRKYAKAVSDKEIELLAHS